MGFGKKSSSSASSKKKPDKKKVQVSRQSEEKKDSTPSAEKKRPVPAQDSEAPKTSMEGSAENREEVAAVAEKLAEDDSGSPESGTTEADSDQMAHLMALAEEGKSGSGNGNRGSDRDDDPILNPKKDKNKPAKSKSDKENISSFDEGMFDDEEEFEEDTGGDEVTSLRLQRARNRIWLDLRDGIDLKALARMDSQAAREEVSSAVEEISRFRNLDITPAELEQIARECADDMLGYGPLETLLERDDIADIMINGPDTTYIEVNGKIQRTRVKFRDNQHLTTVCQRIVGAIGRRVDESSPICDARLPDGSRVNVIIPPLAVDGSCMTIRKFTKEKLTLEKLVGFGSMTPSCAKLVMAIGRCRVNCLISGGTGSGKTTMLNCLTRYIDSGERIITCEDACELQLQQPHVVRLETRPPNLEGVGEVTMRDLVKNCLRMRPERIIVGEVRGPEAFDLLQAMNTGHDGSMGTVHANNPREALSRMENMIAMGGLNLPQQAVREQIAGAVNVIIQVQRLRDGSRKTTHVTEITGMEGEVVTMQDLFVLDIEGEDEDGKLITRQRSTGLRPRFYDQARQYGVDHLVLEAMEEAFDQ